MPNPIIILSHHYRSSPYKFISDNVSLLKELGYTKLLLELDSKVSPESFKQENNNLLLRLPKESLAYKSIQALVDMLLTLEKNKIQYAFIDPETGVEAAELNTKIRSAQTDEERSKAITERESATKLRDIAMANVIQDEAKSHDGGVIFIGGFRHKELLPQLNLIDPFSLYRPVIFADRREEALMITPKVKDGDFDHWLGLYKKTARDVFYGIDVSFFDMADAPSFETIQLNCGFTTSQKPYIELSTSRNTLFQNKITKLIKKYDLPDANQTSLEKGLRNAASNNKVEDLKCFIKCVKNLDAQDANLKTQRTALHWAAIKGNGECYQLLIQAGADPMVSDATKKTAIDYNTCSSLHGKSMEQ